MRVSTFNKVLILAVMIVAVGLVAAPQQAQAQDVATASASATVQTALAVSVSQNMLFPTVLQGIATTLAVNNDDSTGQFAITGQASAGVNLHLTLPDYLALSDGSDRMTITFSSTDAVVDTTVATPSTVAATDGWVAQNPRSLPAAAVIGAGGQTNVYLGGKVTPKTYQSAGTYSGDVVLSVAYNGN